MRILILTSSTGGGHDMRARSLKAWAEQTPQGRALGFEVEIFQTLESLGGTYAFGVGLYNWIQRRAPWLHHVYFGFLERANLHRNAGRIANAARFVETVQALRPQVIVSTHAHLNHGFFELARQALGAAHVRCVTYCGELSGGYGFSRHWVNPQADAFIGASAECCQAARELGMADAKTFLGGFLLNPHFWDEPLSQAERDQWVREHLQLDPHRFILTLGTGANGANNHIAFLNALLRSRLPVQVLALCGRNEQARVQIGQWARRNPQLPVCALGYTGKMQRVFAASDLMVARPGTGTTSEAIRMQCPVLFNGVGGVMPQECITVKFARLHGLPHAVVSRPSQLPKRLLALLQTNKAVGDRAIAGSVSVRASASVRGEDCAYASVSISAPGLDSVSPESACGAQGAASSAGGAAAGQMVLLPKIRLALQRVQPQTHPRDILELLHRLGREVAAVQS